MAYVDHVPFSESGAIATGFPQVINNVPSAYTPDKDMGLEAAQLPLSSVLRNDEKTVQLTEPTSPTKELQIITIRPSNLTLPMKPMEGQQHSPMLRPILIPANPLQDLNSKLLSPTEAVYNDTGHAKNNNSAKVITAAKNGPQKVVFLSNTRNISPKVVENTDFPPILEPVNQQTMTSPPIVPSPAALTHSLLLNKDQSAEVTNAEKKPKSSQRKRRGKTGVKAKSSKISRESEGSKTFLSVAAANEFMFPYQNVPTIITSPREGVQAAPNINLQPLPRRLVVPQYMPSAITQSSIVHHQSATQSSIVHHQVPSTNVPSTNINTQYSFLPMTVPVVPTAALMPIVTTASNAPTLPPPLLLLPHANTLPISNTNGVSSTVFGQQLYTGNARNPIWMLPNRSINTADTMQNFTKLRSLLAVSQKDEKECSTPVSQSKLNWLEALASFQAAKDRSPNVQPNKAQSSEQSNSEQSNSADNYCPGPTTQAGVVIKNGFKKQILKRFCYDRVSPA